MAKKKAEAKKETKDIIVVGSKTREAVKSFEMNMSGEFVEALSEKAHELVQNAVARAQANGRKTLRATDL